MAGQFEEYKQQFRASQQSLLEQHMQPVRERDELNRNLTEVREQLANLERKATYHIPTKDEREANEVPVALPTPTPTGLPTQTGAQPSAGTEPTTGLPNTSTVVAGTTNLV